MLKFNFVAHASELVCVSIGANLLLPVAPAIMTKFFVGIEVDPDKIVAKNFGEELSAYLRDEDLRRIGSKAVDIKHRQGSGEKSPGLFWRVLDVIFAVAGVFLLWSGWIDNSTVAKWAPLLFLPSVIAVGWPFLCYLDSIISLNWRIFVARRHAKSEKRLVKKNKAPNNEDEIAEFVSIAKASIGAARPRRSA